MASRRKARSQETRYCWKSITRPRARAACNGAEDVGVNKSMELASCCSSTAVNSGWYGENSRVLFEKWES